MDDFEGFGSITAMVQNKDKLVDKKLNDPEFNAELKAEKDKEKQAEELKKQQELQKKKQEEDDKKNRLKGAKAKIESALNKATPADAAKGAPKAEAV